MRGPTAVDREDGEEPAPPQPSSPPARGADDLPPAEAHGDALTRLRWNAQLLRSAHQELTALAKTELTDSYAAEWFLDNYYLVRNAIRQVQQDLPRSYYRKLPRVVTDDQPGEPDVHAL